MTQTTPEAEAPPSLETRLAEWIDGRRITGNYDTAGIAARLVAAHHPSNLERWLGQEDSAYLRHACENIKDHADLTDAEAWAEDWHHGNLRDDLPRWGA